MSDSDNKNPDQRELPLQKRLTLALAPVLLGLLVRFLYATNKKIEVNRKHWDELIASGKPFLVPCWHETGAIILPHFAGDRMQSLTSKSFDGEIAARYIAQFGVKCIRGSSSRGGMNALNEMVRNAPDLVALGFTVDGPRGPRREAKPGLAMLSQRTGLPLLPIASTATKSFRLKSWDRMCIPKPFGTYIIAVGKPIDPPEPGSIDAVKKKTEEITLALNALHDQIETDHGIDARLT